MHTAQTLPAASATRRAVIAGAVTSQLAALIMAVVVMLVFTVFLGKGPLYPVQVIGSVVYGENALQGFQPSALIAGLIAHQLVGLAWGLVFGVAAAALNVTTATRAATLGIAVAVISMIDSYLFVPVVMNHFHGTDIWNREVPMFWNWAAHIVFGLGFGLYPWVTAKLSKYSWL